MQLLEIHCATSSDSAVAHPLIIAEKVAAADDDEL